MEAMTALDLQIINQKNLVTKLKDKLKASKGMHPHDMIAARLQIMMERAKLGLIQNTL